MPSSSSARMTRTAISPRLATRTLENMGRRMLSPRFGPRRRNEGEFAAGSYDPCMSDERILVTGANGCIGAWVIAHLVEEGTPVVALDASDDDHRLRLLLDDAALAGLTRVRGDITDLPALERTLDEHAITHVIHLAALQVPFCRADPPLGARVNVVGTVNVFEAVRRRVESGSVMAPIVYTGSIGMFSASDVDAASGQLREDAEPHPGNH